MGKKGKKSKKKIKKPGESTVPPRNIQQIQWLTPEIDLAHVEDPLFFRMFVRSMVNARMNHNQVFEFSASEFISWIRWYLIVFNMDKMVF